MKVNGFLKRHNIVLLIFFCSFLLRVSLISKGPYQADCLDLAIQAEKTLETGQLQKHFDLGFPLTVMFASFFVFLGRIFAVHDAVLLINFMSVVLSSFCVVFFYIFVKQLLDARTALLSAITLSLNPLFLGLSLYGKNYMPMLFFLFLGIVFILKFRETARYRDFFMAAVLFGCMGAARLQDLIWMFPPVSYLCLVILKHKKMPVLKSFCIFGAIIIITIGFFYLPYIFQSALGGHLFGIFGVAQEQLGGNFKGIFSDMFLRGMKLIADAASPLAVILALIGLCLLYKKEKMAFIFLLFWLIFPTSFYANLRSTLSHRQILLVLPPLLISGGFFISWLAGKKSLKSIIYALFIFMNCLALVSIYPILQIRHEKSYIKDFAQWIGDAVEPNAVIITADENLFIRHYARRATLIRPTSGPANAYLATPEQLNDFKKTVDQLLAQGVPVYITDASLYAYNKDGYFYNFISKHYEGEVMGWHLYEDWHLGELVLQILPMHLYRLKKIT